MKRLLIPAAIVLTALTLAGCFFLPSFMSRLKDKQTVGMLSITDSRGVSFETKFQLQMIDRLKMTANVDHIRLDNGKNMDVDAAFQAALSELGKFNSEDIMALDLAACRLSKHSVNFLIDSADPSKNLIIWSLYIQDDTHTVIAAIDDETGKILSLQYDVSLIAYKKEMLPSAAPGMAKPFDTEIIGQTLADYYELTLVRAELLKSDRYLNVMCELSDGQNTVALYVIITGTGFSVTV